MSAGLVVNNYALPCRARSDATDPADRQEEDLVFGARDTLEDIRQRYGVEMMMAALQPVADHFDCDRNEVLDEWFQHHGPTLLGAVGLMVDPIKWAARRRERGSTCAPDNPTPLQADPPEQPSGGDECPES